MITRTASSQFAGGPNNSHENHFSLSYDKPKASSKASSPHSSIQSFLLQMRVSYPSLRSSSSFLRLLPRLPVTSILPFIFPSITRCRRQFLRKMRPIQFAFRLRISCRIFLCSLTLTISHTSSFLTRSVQLIRTYTEIYRQDWKGAYLMWIFALITRHLCGAILRLTL